VPARDLWLRSLGAEVAGYALEPAFEPSLWAIVRDAVVGAGGRSIIGDIRDAGRVRGVVADTQPQIVIHMAAQALVRESYRDPLATYATNVMGTANVLEACRVCSKLVRRVVVASSDKAYGAHPKLPYTEDTPLEGRFPYDASKSCADLLALSYFETFRLPVGITRCGNLYGGGDLNFSRIVPGTIRSALAGQRPVIRSDGKYVRDYFSVEDAVEAYVHFAEQLDRPELHGQAFNFGTETPVTVLEVVDHILKVMDARELKPVILNEASHEIREQYLDCTKARTLLGWKSHYPLEAGLERTVAWYRSFLGSDRALETAVPRHKDGPPGGR